MNNLIVYECIAFSKFSEKSSKVQKSGGEKLVAPPFDKQKEGGVRSTLLFLGTKEFENLTGTQQISLEHIPRNDGGATPLEHFIFE